MGFYGNITNTSNTTFSFDRIYPNRLAMDANANNDGIFIGRYVLVEYDNKATISNIFVDTQHPAKIIDGEKYYYAYTTDNFTDINTRIQYKPNNRGENKNINVYFLGELGQVQKVETNQLQQEYYTEFYQCVDSIISENDSTIFYALFKYVTKTTKSDSEYIKNFAIDEAEYKEKKGYDSTVWTKASVKKENGLFTEYVRIADLNSVVPTFDLETDAPTMKPLVPHFDADSTNVYYKLHTQPQWGLRVAEVESGKISDSKTDWISSTYDPETGQLIPSEDNGEHDAAIYFNRAAFLSQVDVNRQTIEDIDKKQEDVQEKNYFTINPTGTSGNQYYLHTTIDQNGNLQKVYGTAEDIQEMRINLPAIGNMMSDAWDIIHGPLRDNARTDENSSLQGRLDSFIKMEDNHIPMKRHDDGTLIGTAINGNQKYNFDGKNILTADNFPLTTNDPWIDVTIDNSSLQGGYDKKNKTEISQANNNAIRIRHSANKVDPTTTSWDKNGIETSINNSYNYYNIDTNINGEQDKIKLYVPYVDATGHVVGKNIETVTLPYGYKTFTTAGLAPLDEENREIVEDLYTTINNQVDGNNTSSSSASASTSIANNTQDSIAIEPYNKWIQTQLSDDKLVIAHEVHAINTEKDTTDLNDLKDDKIQNEINIPDWDYDAAGHIKKKGEHTYTLPYGFKTINVGNDTTESVAPAQTGIKGETADNTQDSLTFKATNKWIKMAAVGEDKENKIAFGHELSDVITTDKELTNLNAETTKSDSIIIPDWSYDSAGHITSKQKHEYILPYGYKSFTDGTNNSIANSTQDEFKLIGDDWLQPIVANDTITYKHIGPVSADSYTTKNNIENPQFGSQFEIEDWHFDSKGHKNNLTKHIVQFPKGSIEHPTATSNNSEIITSLSFVPESGKISYQKDNSSTLKLTTDYTNNGIGAGNIAGGDSLNTAFAKLEKQIMQEANTRATDILKEASDRDTAIKTAIANLVDSAPDNINTLGEIVAWLDNDGDEKIDIIKDITSNASKIEEEIGRATEAEQGLQDRIDALGTAAKENKEYFATAKQGSTAEATATTIATYGDIVTYNAEDFVLKSEYNALLSDFNELKALVEQLNNQINPPQQPDEGGETV